MELTNDDVRSTSMGASGVDVLLSAAAKRFFPYSVECKNLARIGVYSLYDQCLDNVHPDTTGLLVIKQNHSEPLAVVSLAHFMELTSLAYQNRSKE